MAVAFRAAGTFVESSGGASTVVPYPAGVASGDLLVIQFATSGSSATPTTPSGWTKLFGPINTTGGNPCYVFYRVAGGSEPSTVSFTMSLGSGAGIMCAYTGADATTPIDVYATAATATSGTTATTPSVTTTVANTMLLRMYWAFANPGITPAGTDTERYEGVFTSQSLPMECATSIQASAGASGTTTATFTGAGGIFGGLGATIAIAPVAAAIPVADFTGTPLSGTRPLSVAFTDSSTNSPTSWAWTFGDGGTSTSQNPTHSYTTAGTFTVVLVATNAGGSNTKTRTGYVTVANPSGTFVKIKWGERLVVTDEGGGVIRVDVV